LEQSDTSAVGFDPVASESKSTRDLKTWVSKLTKKVCFVNVGGNLCLDLAECGAECGEELADRKGETVG
jgi:hypothetical protein